MITIFIIFNLFLTSSGIRTVRPTKENVVGERSLHVTNKTEGFYIGLEYWGARYSVRLRIPTGREYVYNDTVRCTPITVAVEQPRFRYVYYCHSQNFSWMEKDGCLDVLPYDFCVPPPSNECQSISISHNYFFLKYYYYQARALVSFEETNLTMTYQYSECMAPESTAEPPTTTASTTTVATTTEVTETMTKPIATVGMTSPSAESETELMTSTAFVFPVDDITTTHRMPGLTTTSGSNDHRYSKNVGVRSLAGTLVVLILFHFVS